MPITDLHALDHLAWELDNPSTRTSMHLITKWAPVDVTLASSNTAQNLFTADLTEPIVNLVTNPSMETGTTPPTGYVATGATVTKSSTVTRSATNSMSIDPANSATGEGAYWLTETISGLSNDPNSKMTLNANVYLQDNANGNAKVRIEIRSADGTTTHAVGNEITLTNAWQRSHAFFPIPGNGAAYTIYIVTSDAASNAVFYADDLMVSLQRDSAAKPYCDGAQGLYYEWIGTANASRSVRRRGLVAIRGYNLYVSHGTYLAYDQTASSTLGRLVRAGTDISQDRLHFNSISMINSVSGETPRIYGEILGVHNLKSDR